jgi:predicted dithiol-disulfide oxidoreductase (DUF899 family)
MAQETETAHRIVAHDEWVEARKQHLLEEKRFTQERDRLSRARRELPWELVEKEYVFDGPRGRETLSDLFHDRRQLVIYHAMFDPATASERTSWTEDAACPLCSWWLDNLNGMAIHLQHGDVTAIAVSKAPYSKIEAYSRRMGWTFDWFSSGGSDFNHDYGVSFTREEVASKVPAYNYGSVAPFQTENPGMSVFIKDRSAKVFHTYSTCGRGLDMLNLTYHYLDLVPKGRNEKPGQWWVRRHDEYKD